MAVGTGGGCSYIFGRVFLFGWWEGCFVVVFSITRIMQDVHIKIADRLQILIYLQCTLVTQGNISKFLEFSRFKINYS